MAEQPREDDTAVYMLCLDEIRTLIHQQIQRQYMDPTLYGEIWRACFVSILAGVIRQEGMLPVEIDAYLRFTFDRTRAEVTETVRKWDDHGPIPPTP